MAGSDNPQDAITTEEMLSTTVPNTSTSHTAPKDVKRNAFTELMSHTSKKSTTLPSTSTTSSKPTPKPRVYYGRDGLGAYVDHPSSFPASVVIFHSSNYVALVDKFPKSTVHTLLCPRGEISLQHPVQALNDPDFLAATKLQAEKLKDIVAAELRRKYGKFSLQDRAREAALNGETELADGAPLPTGRDWAAEVKIGIHLHPSMNHLHIHVLSRDMYSDCLKHRNHYNSFNTPFFVPLEDFPLKEGDERLDPNFRWLDGDMKCWRCGEGFGRKMKALKDHLRVEFEKWKRE